jgi:hypothetical protein
VRRGRAPFSTRSGPHVPPDAAVPVAARRAAARRAAARRAVPGRAGPPGWAARHRRRGRRRGAGRPIGARSPGAGPVRVVDAAAPGPDPPCWPRSASSACCSWLAWRGRISTSGCCHPAPGGDRGRSGSAAAADGPRPGHRLAAGSGAIPQHAAARRPVDVPRRGPGGQRHPGDRRHPDRSGPAAPGRRPAHPDRRLRPGRGGLDPALRAGIGARAPGVAVAPGPLLTEHGGVSADRCDRLRPGAVSGSAPPAGARCSSSGWSRSGPGHAPTIPG